MEPYAHVLNRLIVRRDYVLCAKCGAMEPVNPGDGTPASTFILALERLAAAHRNCSVEGQKAKEKAADAAK